MQLLPAHIMAIAAHKFCEIVRKISALDCAC